MNDNSTMHDVLIIGSGAAGLALALSIADIARVLVVSKNELASSSSTYAQGGIAAVMDGDDNYESHIEDTLAAGDGLCNRSAVEFTVRNAKKAIHWLVDHGVEFTTQDNNQQFHLTKEGGHSHRRILHSADRTGSAVTSTLIEQVQQHPNIECLTQHTAVDLIVREKRCCGVILYDNNSTEMKSHFAKMTVLATGGASSVYLHTSNPDATFGGGIAMAWRAGCRVADLEFNQFHPTCLYNPGASPFLITEAMRGEGALLRLPNGERFMPAYDNRAELAPRDIVARAIDTELKKHGLDYVYLDITHRSADMIEKFFPTIVKKCREIKLDITREMIPVVPAAHYTCGGVLTNLKGQTDLANLCAIGEVACTGLHGANRMASNSLLECLVFAASAAQDIREKLINNTDLLTFQKSTPPKQDENLDLHEIQNLIRKTCWENVGIVRNNQRLNTALQLVSPLAKKLHDLNFTPHSFEYLETRNLACVAELMIRSALSRKESRGLHYSTDYPDKDEIAEHTVLVPPYFTPSITETI